MILLKNNKFTKFINIKIKEIKVTNKIINLFIYQNRNHRRPNRNKKIKFKKMKKQNKPKIIKQNKSKNKQLKNKFNLKNMIKNKNMIIKRIIDKIMITIMIMIVRMMKNNKEPKMWALNQDQIINLDKLM